MSQNLIRVVIDSNVFIRYLIRPSSAIRSLIEDLWLDDKIVVVTAPELVDELNQVFQREALRAYIHPTESQAILEIIELKTEILPPLGTLPSFTRDPKDDKFVACAIAGKADYLITEDKDLLDLGSIAELQILTPYDFFHQINPSK